MYEELIGVLFPSSWASGFLLAVEVKQMITYFTVYRKDAIYNRIGVLVALLADVICTISIMTALWSWLITHFGEVAYAETSIPWGISAYCMTTSISALCCHLVLLGRIRDLSRNAIVAAVILPIALGGFVVGCITTHWLVLADPRQQNYSIIWAGIRAGTDVVIAIAIIVYGNLDKTTIASSNSMLQRIFLTIVSTGAVNAILSILTLILLVALPETHIGSMFSMIIGRTFTCTMVSNLNTRLENRTLPEDDAENTATRNDNYGLKSRNGGVRVDRSVVIQADREEFNAAVQPSVLYSNSHARTYDNDGADNVSWDDRKQESQVDLVK